VIIMDLKSQKRMAARIIGCGKSRIWIDPVRIADVAEAITAEDVRKYIKDGVIVAIPKDGISSFRRKRIIKQKSKGRRRGLGSRKGRKGARTPSKAAWMKRIRSLRKFIGELKSTGRIDNVAFKDVYKKSKSGMFRSKAHVTIYLERNKMLKEAKTKQ
jgi:large subunit ribosomal protein L19e